MSVLATHIIAGAPILIESALLHTEHSSALTARSEDRLFCSVVSCPVYFSGFHSSKQDMNNWKYYETYHPQTLFNKYHCWRTPLHWICFTPYSTHFSTDGPLSCLVPYFFWYSIVVGILLFKRWYKNWEILWKLLLLVILWVVIAGAPIFIESALLHTAHASALTACSRDRLCCIVFSFLVLY